MRARQIKAFVKRDLRLVFRDKAAVFWLIAWPLIWVFMVAYVFVPPGSVTPVKLEIGVVNMDEGSGNFTGRDLIAVLENATYHGDRLFNIHVYNETGEMISDIRRGALDAGMVIPRNFSRNLTVGSARLRVYIGFTDIRSASITQGVLRGFLDEVSTRIGLVKANITIYYMQRYMEEGGVYNQSRGDLVGFLRRYMIGIAMPLNTSYEEVRPEAFETRETIIGWYTLGAIGMMFLYTGFSQGAAAVYREKEAGTLRRILASPTTPSTLVTAIVLSNLVIFLITAAIVLLAGVYGAGARIVFDPANPAHLLAPILLLDGALLSLGIGMLLSPLAKTSQGASSLGIALGLMLTFTAGIWFPRQMMPAWMSVLAEYFPPTWVFDTLRNIMVYGVGVGEVLGDVAKIAVATLIILIGDVAVYRLRLRRYLEEA